MEFSIVTAKNIESRSLWIDEISLLSGNFGVDSDRVMNKMSDEIESEGIAALLGHLRLCGAIPERYAHDSSEEKLYSKYTDIVIHEAYAAIGLTSVVLKERADVADVECVCSNYSFVADAKAFRLSRTAKNQKDFKVEAMDNWKHGKPFAMVVCPVYQLPSRSSQIYQQAAARSVCIGTYTHLAVLVRYADIAGQSSAISLLHDVFRAVEAMKTSKDASAYWQAVNRVFLNTGPRINDVWREEKIASVDSVEVAKEEALHYLALERERIMRLTRKEAIREVLAGRKLKNRQRAVNNVKYNGLLEIN